MSARIGGRVREYPTTADAYELIEECGRGVSATVWRAMILDTREEVAVKKLDLENMNCSLEEIVREAQTMRSLNHPNLLPLHCSFVHQQHLWMVMPYVHGGSVLNIMRYKFQDGLEEPAIATIMKEVLKALEYLHRNGIIHRDIKAGNILLDDDGHVLLADFGVAATLERGGSWGNRIEPRNTFVGTPCWMAPEVMQQEQGYDARADIWSFGITLLELAHGHAPFAKLPPMKVLLMTLQNPPPTLDSANANSKKHFSKAMRDIVAKCLMKDPTQRPSAAQLLDHKFFKTAHDAHYLQQHVLKGLPPVPIRVEQMRRAHGVGGDIGPAGVQEREILASQQEYRRGVSSWNFDVEAIKAAAAAAAVDADAHRLESINEEASIGGGAAFGGDVIHRSTSNVTAASEQAEYHQQQQQQLVAGGIAVGLGAGLAAAASGAPTPGKSAAGTGAARSGAIKEHGRFKVYEGSDEPPPFSPPTNGAGASLMEEAMGRASKPGTPGPYATSSVDESAGGVVPGTDGGEAGDKAKRKGRFRYVETEDAETKPRLTKTTSTASGLVDGRSSSAAGGASGLANVGVLLGPLKELLESATLQHEALREMVAAVGDADKGKMGALSAFLQQRQQIRPPSREEALQLQAEVAELREENAKLRERVRLLLEGGSGVGSAAGSRKPTTSAEEGSMSQ